jgi:hypothetical protein
MWNNLTVKINDRTGYSGAYIEDVLSMVEEAARKILEEYVPYLDEDGSKSWYINLEETER